MLKILVDENIAFANSAFNQFGKVELRSGREITNLALKDVDVLIVRSITNVNKQLLNGTPVKFVGTATIGTDHIDLDYLIKNNIFFADAKGCNAYSVAEYVVAALLNLAVKFNFSLKEKSMGIVGVGNVGSKVLHFAEALGMNVLLNDPPLKRAGDKRSFVELDEILKCDIISLHTPLNLTGVDKTFHLLNKDNLNKTKDGTIIINSSRGAVINNNDLLDIVIQKNLKVVLDVWEHEPNPNLHLLEKTIIATPHIAGYSYEGKVNGTKSIYEALCDFLKVEKSFGFNIQSPADSIKSFNKENKLELSLNSLIESIYEINSDNERMKRMLNMNEFEKVNEFDLLRKNYPHRREFNNYTIFADTLEDKEIKLLKDLRFNVL